jgi:hypothetical protein
LKTGVSDNAGKHFERANPCIPKRAPFRPR